MVLSTGEMLIGNNACSKCRSSGGVFVLFVSMQISDGCVAYRTRGKMGPEIVPTPRRVSLWTCWSEAREGVRRYRQKRNSSAVRCEYSITITVIAVT